MATAVTGAAKAAEAVGLGGKLLPQRLQDAVRAPVSGQDGLPILHRPGTEGGAVEPEVLTQPGNVSADVINPPSTQIVNIPYGGEFMAQQPVMQGGAMLGSPMVYNRVAQVARTLAGRGGIGGLATGVGIGGLAGSLLDSGGRPMTVPQQVRAVTGMSFTRKTQLAYKNLAEMTGLSNAAACLGIPEQLFCQALIHRFPTRRRGISAAQLRTAKRVNGTIARMHKELSAEFKGATRRAPARRTSTVIQNS